MSVDVRPKSVHVDAWACAFANAWTSRGRGPHVARSKSDRRSDRIRVDAANAPPMARHTMASSFGYVPTTSPETREEGMSYALTYFVDRELLLHGPFAN